VTKPNWRRSASVQGFEGDGGEAGSGAEIEEPRRNDTGALKGRAYGGVSGDGGRNPSCKPETHQWGSGSPSRKKIGFRGCPEAKVIAKFLLLS
jgi:hypothetical protein